MKKITLLAAFVAIVFTLVEPATVPAADPTGSEPKSPEAIASIYVVDLVATAAFGVAMNDAGDVTGTSYPDPGCGSSCLPPLETVVWKGGQRIVLPDLRVSPASLPPASTPGLGLRVRWVLWFWPRGGMEAERQYLYADRHGRAAGDHKLEHPRDRRHQPSGRLLRRLHSF